MLRRNPDELQAFHGTRLENILPIAENGFDSRRRSGQVYGVGEYFAKEPQVSVGYCNGGDYMLVCSLWLGRESADQKNRNGDHIWVPQCRYYVVSEPTQALPRFIVRFRTASIPPHCHELDRTLALPSYDTKQQGEAHAVPSNPPCDMEAEVTDFLWIGYLHDHISDEALKADICKFLSANADGCWHPPEPCEEERNSSVQIIKGMGKYKIAHVFLRKAITRDLVSLMSTAVFTEGGVERMICVTDGHGSRTSRCPHATAGYCRGHNLRFTNPCWCRHDERPAYVHHSLKEIGLETAKGEELSSKFMTSAPFHDGCPRIVKIHAIKNTRQAQLFSQYRLYLAKKNGEEPPVRELYHGTNCNILETIYMHGLHPPSDCQASERCPVSGGKGLSTSICSNTCEFCTDRHAWNKCHMYGLGIYLADIAQKSHRYVSQPSVKLGRRSYCMVVCSVLGRAFEVAGHLKVGDAMHDTTSIRSLAAHGLDSFLEPCSSDAQNSSEGGYSAVELHDLLFIKGLGSSCRPGLSVFNSEYIAFHPHQCLPKYQITYEMDA